MTVQILIGDALARLKELPAESAHCCVTSPPYWGLRDYGVAGQIGLEATPQEWVVRLVEIFHQVRRVLRSDGTLWLNLGDSYAGSGRGGNPTEATSTLEGGQDSQRASMVRRTRGADEIGATARDAAVTNIGRRNTRGINVPTRFSEGADAQGRIHTSYVRALAGGLKDKDLVGAPWMLAFALRADGWWLRQDIIWSKPNPMPESVTDRCTKAHEYLFLLSKSERYYFDQEAILEAASPNTHARLAQNVAAQIGSDRAHAGGKTNGAMKAVARKGKYATPDAGDRAGSSFKESAVLVTPYRNKRSVWTVGTQPFKEAHFATFPPALIEPCILAGSPRGGGRTGPFRRCRHDRPGGRPARPRRDPDRTQPRIRRDGPQAPQRRCRIIFERGFAARRRPHATVLAGGG